MCKEREKQFATRYSNEVMNSYNTQMDRLDKLIYFLGITVDLVELKHTSKTPITKFTCTKDNIKIELEVSSTGIKILNIA